MITTPSLSEGPKKRNFEPYFSGSQKNFVRIFNIDISLRGSRREIIVAISTGFLILLPFAVKTFELYLLGYV